VSTQKYKLVAAAANRSSSGVAPPYPEFRYRSILKRVQYCREGTHEGTPSCTLAKIDIPIIL